MLTSRTEKWLYGKFERERNRALRDSSSFAASGEDYSLDDLGIANEGEGVNDPDTYLLDSTPADPDALPKGNAVDIRQLPGHD